MEPKTPTQSEKQEAEALLKAVFVTLACMVCSGNAVQQSGIGGSILRAEAMFEGLRDDGHIGTIVDAWSGVRR